jgi:hypothetical protein
LVLIEFSSSGDINSGDDSWGIGMPIATSGVAGTVTNGAGAGTLNVSCGAGLTAGTSGVEYGVGIGAKVIPGAGAGVSFKVIKLEHPVSPRMRTEASDRAGIF